MSRRIPLCFAALASAGRTALIPFVTAGDPQPGWTVAIMHALVDAGANLLELGVPFTDPAADGPVIRQASQRAIEKHVCLRTVLGTVEAFRQQDDTTPVILMSYMQSLADDGLAQFPPAAKSAGVDGLLVVDCPPGERDKLGAAINAAGLDDIMLVVPSTARHRLAGIAAAASGFIYYVSLKGKTGSGQLKLADLAGPIQQIREFSDLPVAVGFGIKNADMAAAVAVHSDAVVMGSALVEVLSAARSKAEACAISKAFVAPVRKALDNTDNDHSV